jgi:RNase P subunit RPR2
MGFDMIATAPGRLQCEQCSSLKFYVDGEPDMSSGEPQIRVTCAKCGKAYVLRWAEATEETEAKAAE